MSSQVVNSYDRLAPAPSGTICITAEAGPVTGAIPTEAERQLEEQLAERLSVNEPSSSGADLCVGPAHKDGGRMCQHFSALSCTIQEPLVAGREDASPAADSYEKSQSNRGGRCSYTQIGRLVKVGIDVCVPKPPKP